MLERKDFTHDGLRFSYLERRGGGEAGVLVLLHAHWMGASDFEDIMPTLPPDWRVAALDQRGHGRTEHGGGHSIDAYVGDLDAFLNQLAAEEPVVLLGHSFGGMVANLYAAARQDRVRGLILEDIEVARDDHADFILQWAGVYPTREALEARIGPRLAPYLRRSMVQDAGGWRLAFDPQEVLASEQALNGDHWREWLAHNCPALVIRGARSVPVNGEVLAEMARRRANTELVTLDAGHSVHIDAPQAFVEVVSGFLDRLAAQPVSRGARAAGAGG